MAQLTEVAFSLIMTDCQYHKQGEQHDLAASPVLEHVEAEGVVLVTAGELALQSDNNPAMKLGSGQGVWIRQGETVWIESAGRSSAHVWVRFVARAAFDGSDDDVLLSLRQYGRQVTFDPADVIPMAEALAAPVKEGGGHAGIVQLQKQQQFLALLLLLWQPVDSQEAEEQVAIVPPDPVQLVQQTIVHMQQQFRRDMRVQRLADSIDMPRWQYLRLFKQMTGLRPGEYLTRLRMEEAQKRLRAPGARIWEVAHQVGYEDEQYFSRRFKQVVGISPGNYARAYSTSQQVKDWRGSVQIIPARPKRIVYDDASTLGDLLVFGVSPIGANLRDLSETLSVRTEPVQEIGFPVQADKVRALNPDLILLSRYGYEKASPVAEIAPTLGLNEYAPLYKRVLKLGEVLDLRHIAKRWLQDHEARSAQIWSSLQDRKTRDATAVMLYVTRNKRVYVMDRKRGINHLLYHPLGFRMDERLVRLRQMCNSYYIEANTERLLDYAVGQWLFVLHDEQLDATTVRTWLRSCPDWDRLEAVQADQVRMISGCYNNDDALNSEVLLEAFADLW